MKWCVAFTAILVILLGIFLTQIHWQYEYPGWTRTVNITGSEITFTRSENMILRAKGKDSKSDHFKSLGWMHAHDRYAQLCLYRLAAHGLLTKYLPYSEAILTSDIKVKRMNIVEISEKSVPYIGSNVAQMMQDYVDGINTYFTTNSRPLELVLLNYFPAPFTVVDCLSIFNLISYAGLNDISLTTEKLIIEMVSQNEFLDRDLVKYVFSPHLDGLNDELVSIYKSLKDMVPLAGQYTHNVPKLVNSNNWVISGNLSESGMPMMGSDPHMDISNNPNAFYETHYISDDGFKVLGISVPGVPGIIFGRTHYLAFSLTFGMLDLADYFIENIQNMEYERDGQFYPLRERKYTNGGRTLYFYDTAEGHSIERNIESVQKPLLANGRYLASKFSISIESNVATYMNLQGLLYSKDIHDAMKYSNLNGIGSNYLFCDISGNIAYQQGGMVPRRLNSNGLLPLPAWKSENLWKGYLNSEDYHSIINPSKGYIATANNHIQAENKPIVTTFCAANDRINRINTLLQSKKKFGVDDFKQFQSDTYSLIAERTVPMIRPFLGDSGIEKELTEWDYIHTIDSRPAAFFKIFYKNLSVRILLELFDANSVNKYMLGAAYPMQVFVNKILETGHVGNTPITDLIKPTLEDTLKNYKDEVYGDIEKVYMRNIMFGGKLPAWVGVDVGPKPTSHCNECVKHSHMRTSPLGKTVHISQTWRMVTDMGTDEIHSVLPGGPNGNFLSNIYGREVDLFINDKYKKTNL